MPTISIIVPVYKAEDYLPECLDSILAQTFTDFELILINDGSPDNSGAICDSYAKKDNRIKVIHQTNGGASAARNVGIQKAQSKYVGWVDADDRIAADMYSTLYSLIESYRADIAECQYYEFKGNTNIRKSGLDEPIVYGNGEFIMKEFFNSQMKPSLSNKLYKKEIWKNIRFPLGRNHQDFYVNIRFALMPLTYVRTSEAKYYYMIRNNSITTTRTSRELREAIYAYYYTINLSNVVAKTKLAKRFLKRDAINRLIGRYVDVAVNSNIKNLVVYNYYLRKILGWKLVKYILFTDLPLKTRISYILVISNLQNLQIFLHKHLGKNK